MKFLDLTIVLLFLLFTLKACGNKTSLVYEIGKECKFVKSEFILGINETN